MLPRVLGARGYSGGADAILYIMKKLLFGAAALVVMVCSGVGVWAIVRATTSQDDSSAPVSSVSAGQPITLDTSGAEGGVALDTTPKATSGGDQKTGVNGAATQSSGVPVVNPTKFAQYDSQKKDKATLFAEIKPGTGTEVTAASEVTINYRGWLTNGAMFDQNVSSDKPFSFAVAGGGVIPGFAQGVLGMKVGGERLVVIPPELGYGNMAYGPIPGDSVLVFDIKLLSAK